jgi:hypothetical protein
MNWIHANFQNFLDYVTQYKKLLIFSGYAPQLINFVDVFWESEINRIRYKFESGQWKRHNLEVSI